MVAPDPDAIHGALHDGKLLWLDVEKPTPDDVDLLRTTFDLHPLAVGDLTEFGQRPKVEDFGNLVYMVWYAVAGDPGAPSASDGGGLADLTEVHCFCADNFFVTVRHSGCHTLEQMHDNPVPLPGGVDPGRPVRLVMLHTLADRMIDSFFPPLAELDDRIDDLQEKIFTKPTNDQLASLFAMQRWLVGARKLISPERDMVASLVSGMVVVPGTTPESDPYLRDLYDHLIRISDLVDSYRDLLSNAMDAYLSMVSNKLNEVMKQLAVIATVFLPLSFLTGFFGQNFAWLVARLGSLGSFLILGLGTELVAVVLLYLLFRRRGWIGGG
jgi:magnesium transporter